MRCAVHSARPAVDRCPVCGRPRCRPDADRYAASGCEACQRAARVRVPSTAREIVVRAGLAAVAVAAFDGWVETQYVRVHLMSLVAPIVGGLAAGWACKAAAGKDGQRIRTVVLAIACVSAVLGAALAFRLNSGGGLSPTTPIGRVGPPYLMSIVGVVLWQLVFAAPRRQPVGDGDAEDPEPGDGIAL
jgi:hypothetical protein